MILGGVDYRIGAESPIAWSAPYTPRHRRSPGRQVLGITFKEIVPGIRNSRVVDILREFEEFGITVQRNDPEADGDLLHEEYGLTLMPLDAMKLPRAVVLAVANRKYRERGGGPGEGS